MNTFGTKYRVTIFGESHGPAIGVVLDGVRAGVPISAADFAVDLERRGRGELPDNQGVTPRVEADELQFIAGLHNGHTTGGALTILVPNMNTQSTDYQGVILHPRPSHADFVAAHKHKGFNDHRGGGSFSGRMTVGLVIAGVVARKLLPAGVVINSKIAQIGPSRNPEEWGEIISATRAQGDSIGGVVECTTLGLPVGVGAPFFDSVESLLAHLLFAIPAVRGVEFGSGFAAAGMLGSEHNDPIINTLGTTKTNHSGGVVGGLSNGNPLHFRVAIKPTASIPMAQQTMKFEDQTLKSGTPEALQIRGRHDTCIAARVPVIVESAVAIALLNLL